MTYTNFLLLIDGLPQTNINSLFIDWNAIICDNKSEQVIYAKMYDIK